MAMALIETATTIGIAVDDPSLASSMASLLSSRAGHAPRIFDGIALDKGMWPSLPSMTVIASPRPLRRRMAQANHAMGRPRRLILAIERQSLPVNRELIARVDGICITDEALEHIAGIVSLSEHRLTLMPRAHADAQLQVSHQLEGLSRLSRRDVEVLKELACGRGNQAIAEHLGMSIPTAKTHVRRIVERLGFRNRTDAAVFAAVALGSRSAPGE